MKFWALALAVWLAAAGASAAAEFTAVRDRAAFLALVDGRTLQMRMFGISIAVKADGTITGSALGWPVTGSWKWSDGHFCRTMDWSGMPIPYNCQLVEVRGTGEMRFTVDRGRGDSASFKLR